MDSFQVLLTLKEQIISSNISPQGDNWNAVWDSYIENNKNASRIDVLCKLRDMERAAGIGQYRAVKFQPKKKI